MGLLAGPRAKRVGVTALQVNEVLTYYSMLHRRPLGKYHVQVCTNISCLLWDGDRLWEHACEKLGIGHKEVTADGQISLEEVECMGACSWAPAIQVNYDFHHHVTPEKLDAAAPDLFDAQGPLPLDCGAPELTTSAPACRSEAPLRLPRPQAGGRGRPTRGRSARYRRCSGARRWTAHRPRRGRSRRRPGPARG